MTVKLLTEQYLDCLSLKGGCTCLSDSIHVKMPHCWKSHVVAHFIYLVTNFENNLIFAKIFNPILTIFCNLLFKSAAYIHEQLRLDFITEANTMNSN